jgi:hypothetical protein
MTKRHLEKLLYLAAALVCGMAPSALPPVVADLLMAAINLAMAICI